MRQSVSRSMLACVRAVAAILMVLTVMTCTTMVFAAEKSEAQAIVDKSKGTFTEVINDARYTSWLHTFIKDSKGVLIFPQILKGGFVFGGSGGTGVLLAYNKATGTWSDPAFYSLGSVTFGFQIGGEAAEVVMVAVNQKAIDSLLSSSVKLGGDASIAVGPVGGGAKGAMTVPEVTADFVSFSRAKGVYAGLNLEGTVLQVRDDLNRAYYGRNITPRDILTHGTAGEPGADALRSVLERAIR